MYKEITDPKVRICKTCLFTFEKKTANQKYCSFRCYAGSKRKRVWKECAVCNKLFSIKRYLKKMTRTCSTKCMAKSRRKTLIQMKNGVIIGTYSSGKEAQEKTGIWSGNISKVVNGKGYSAGGFQWKFCNNI